ncbi:MAG: membrane dipeptidase [bacterium]|nr:membrane dipeptidase [bacterium]
MRISCSKQWIFLVLILVLSIYCYGEQSMENLEKKAADIHERVLTIDTHADTPLRLMRGDFDLSISHDSKKEGGRVDFPRMKKGGLDAIFFAVFLGQGKRTPEAIKEAKELALQIFEKVHKSLKANPDLAQLALTPDDAYRIEKAGKRAIYIGLENGYPIGKDIAMVKTFYDLGARYITLCHTSNNDICDSSTDEKAENNGLSVFGRLVVKEMNRLGMVVDVSHISDKAFFDVLEVSSAPVLASHSCARAICDNPRNLTDGMLKKLAEKDGVIQVCFLGDYLVTAPANPERKAAYDDYFKKYPDYWGLPDDKKKLASDLWYSLKDKFPVPPATVSDLVDHIDHIVRVVGIDHVGIGTDFDGGGSLKDCADVSQMGNITLELVKRGYNEEQIRKIWGGNFMRLFRKVASSKRQ